MSEGPQRARPVAAILLIILANSLIPVVDAMAKVLVQREYSVSEVIWSRYFFHLVPLLACMPFVGWRRMIVSGRLGLQIGRAAVLAAGTGLFIQAISLVPLAEAYAVSFVSPLILTCLAAWWLKERVGIDQWLSVGIGLVGVLIVLQPAAGAVFQAAMLLPLGMATCWALFQVATRSLSFTDGAWTTLFYTGLVGVLGFLPTAAAAWRMPATEGDLVLLAALGIIGLSSHVLIINAFRLAPASVLAPFVYVQLIFGILFGFFFFAESVDLTSFLGMALIALTGLYCVCRQRVPGAETS
ncbi:MAG: DMT family transporter [Parvibaculaceae bacterium]